MFLLRGVGGGGGIICFYSLTKLENSLRYIQLILDLAVLTYYIGIMNIHIDAMSCSKLLKSRWFIDMY